MCDPDPIGRRRCTVSGKQIGCDGLGVSAARPGHKLGLTHQARDPLAPTGSVLPQLSVITRMLGHGKKNVTRRYAQALLSQMRPVIEAAQRLYH